MDMKELFKINRIYANGKTVRYLVVGPAIPTMKFDTYEEAEIVLAIVKLLLSKGIEFDINAIKYIFRLLGVKSVWTE